MTNRNYEFVTNDTISVNGVTLTRIRAIKDIHWHDVKAGDLGGYIEKYENLTENAWVSGNALVFGEARVAGNAWVYDNARVSGNTRVYDNVWVSGNARVYDSVWVYDNAQVYGNTWVSGNARVSGDARVSGNAQVYDNAMIQSTTDYITIGPARSSGRYTTAFVDSEIGVRVVTGCFSGSISEFNSAIESTHANNEQNLRQYRGFVAVIEASF